MTSPPPPYLPELPILPALQLPPYTKRPLPSPPPLDLSPLSPSPAGEEEDYPPRSSVLTKPKHLRSKNLSNRFSKASVSTVSTRARRRNRWDALHALEGNTNRILEAQKKVQSEKQLKFKNAFANPTTFARPVPKPPPPHKRRTPIVPDFINLFDDSDPEPEPNDVDNTNKNTDNNDPDKLVDIYLTQNLNFTLGPSLSIDIDRDPLFEPEDILHPSSIHPPPAPSTPRIPNIFTCSYLDVDPDDTLSDADLTTVLDVCASVQEDVEEEEAVILSATRCPAPASPPPPLSPRLLHLPSPASGSAQTQSRTRTTRVKGPIERSAKPDLEVGSSSIGMSRKEREREREREKERERSKSKHSTSKTKTKTKSKRYPNNPPQPTMTTTRTNTELYKSFIELDIDDFSEDHSGGAGAGAGGGKFGWRKLGMGMGMGSARDTRGVAGGWV